MRLPSPLAPYVPAPWQVLLRITLIGAVCALLIFAGGWILERSRLGTDESAARALVEADVR